jgi:photosystem II stability/assembly factor-like uncharacterized protein
VVSDNYTDIDNNAGTGRTGPNYMVDDIYPIKHGSPTITLDVANRSNDELILWAQTTECIAVANNYNASSRCALSVSSDGGGVATLTVNFGEPVTTNYMSDNTTSVNSFDGRGTLSSVISPGDIDLDNATGTLVTMTANADNITWTGRFIPTNDREVLSNTIALEAGWTDQVGNPGTDNVTLNFEVETYRPQAALTITIAQGTSYDGKHALKPGDNGTLTVVFSDPEPLTVPNFDNITVPIYVNLSTMTSDDNITWTGTFTPVDNSTGANSQSGSYSDNVKFSVADDSFRDHKGNPGDDADSPSFVVDTKPPYVTKVTLNDGLYDLDDTLDGSAPFTNRCIPVHSTIKVTFDYIMETSFITANGDNSTSCIGNIQVSSDNFSSCVSLPNDYQNPTASNDDKTFELDPVDDLSYDTTYQIRVETGVEDVLENNMTSQFNHSGGFRTSALPSSSPTSGVFVAVGEYGETFRSIDNGTSWDNRSCIFLNNHLRGVGFGNNTFVAAGDSGKIIRSTDNASTWSISTSTSRYLNAFTFGSNTFDAVGTSGYTFYSTDNGSTWNSRRAPNSGYEHYYNRNLVAVSFGNSTFVAVGQTGKIVRSIDNGTSWSNVTSGDSPYPYGNNNLKGVSFGNNTFVAVGVSGKIIRSTNNGSSWNNVTSTSPSRDLQGVTFGNNTFVAIGEGGRIQRSTDNGTSWSNVTSNVVNDFREVTFGNNTFVAVGLEGRIVRSTDNGSTWNSVTSGTSNPLYGVIFGE